MKKAASRITWFKQNLVAVLIFASIGLVGCKEDEPEFKPTTPTPSGCDTCSTEIDCNINDLTDTYGSIASGPPSNWAHYNSHDPSILKVGDTYYSYGTDVAYGRSVVFGQTAGHQIRKSTDLVCWQYVGTAFNSYPPQGEAHIEDNGGEPFENLWAPYIMEHNGQYRLYYSLSSSTPRLSCIGLGVSSNPEGPFIESGLVVTSLDNSFTQTNAIDPTVVKTPGGQHYMYYGSAWDGIYVLQLDPATGLALNPGQKGTRVAQRGFSGNTINGNIEGPEVIYNTEFNKYYMFIAYDWIDTKYNVRVVRSDSPEGPFTDFDGNDANESADDAPMILAPYNFIGHAGWQGVSHPAVFEDPQTGNWYMGHQGRPVVDKFFMVLHVRDIHWTEEGWPIVSPERYSATIQSEISESEIPGNWESIVLGYNIVPGFSDTQILPDLQSANPLTIDEVGTLNGDPGSSWTYNSPWLSLNYSNGFTDKVYLERGRDWENNVDATLLFTGLNNSGTAIWGKKVE